MEKQKITAVTKIIQNFCQTSGCRLLYATLFGSHLYGTVISGTSDLDVKGIFLPSREKLLLGEKIPSLHYSTSSNFEKNKAGDIDIELWSVQKWLLELLPEGDVGALDLLFSITNPSCKIFKDSSLETVFNNRASLINLDGSRGYAAYAIRQGKKYAIQGSRGDAIKKVWHLLKERFPDECPKGKAEKFLEELFTQGGETCQIKTLHGERALILGGKAYLASMKLRELMVRVKAQNEACARQSVINMGRGIDWKALSHAIRAITQAKEFMETGDIVFPLANKDELITIKKGSIPWPEIESRITKELAEAANLRKNTLHIQPYDYNLAKKVILSYYQAPFELPDAPQDASSQIYFHSPDQTPCGT